MCEVISFGRHRSICCLWVRLFVCFAGRFCFFFFFTSKVFSCLSLISFTLFDALYPSIAPPYSYYSIVHSLDLCLYLIRCMCYQFIVVVVVFVFSSNKYQQKNGIASLLCDYVYVWNDQTQAWPRQITYIQSCDKQPLPCIWLISKNVIKYEHTRAINELMRRILFFLQIIKVMNQLANGHRSNNGHSDCSLEIFWL